MIKLYRTLILVSLGLLVLSALIPFNHPYRKTFEFDNPPLLPLIAALASILAIPLLFASAIGLLRFRPWSITLGIAAAFSFSVLVIGLLLDALMASAMGYTVAALLVSSLATWICALALTRKPDIKKKFGLAL